MKSFARRSAAILIGCAFSLAFVSSSVASDLIEATRAGDREAVVRLIAEGTDLNAATGDGMSSVHWAAQSGQVEILNALLAAGAAVDSTTRIGSYTPLHIASGQANGAIVRALLEAGADVNATTTNRSDTSFSLFTNELLIATMVTGVCLSGSTRLIELPRHALESSQ